MKKSLVAIVLGAALLGSGCALFQRPEPVRPYYSSKPSAEIPQNSYGTRHKDYVESKTDAEKRKEEEERRKAEEERRKREAAERKAMGVPIPENATGQKASDYVK